MKNKINSLDFAKKMGAYSHGYSIKISDCKIIFTTGQVAMDQNGDVVSPNSVEEQVVYIYELLNKILKQEGSSLNDVVKTTLYVTNMDDFPKISKIRNDYLKNSEPVSTLVEVSRLVKPECKVEIEVIAVKYENKNESSNI